MVDNVTLKNYKLDEEKLLSFGFKKENGKFIFNKKIMDDEFLLEIVIDNGIIYSTVIELSFNEKFALFELIDEENSFVNKMRFEYEEVINFVKLNCAEKEVYKSKNAKEIIFYAKQKYDDELEFLWEDNNSILRNKLTSKWYAVFLVVDYKKLGIKKEGKTEVLNVMLSPDKITKLINNQTFFPAYHMNKTHWISILLDSDIQIDKIIELVDASYNLSNNKNKKK